MQLSILRLLAAVGGIAIVVSAVVSASEIWVILTSLVAYFLLWAAIVNAIVCSGERRSFWIGASIFGWGFFLLSTNVLTRPIPLPFKGIEDHLYRLVAYEVEGDPKDINPELLMETRRNPIGKRIIELPYRKYFNEVIMAFRVITVALLGGLFGSWAYRREQRSSTAG